MIHPLVVYSIYSEIHGLESLGKLIRATCSPGFPVLPPEALLRFCCLHILHGRADTGGMALAPAHEPQGYPATAGGAKAMWTKLRTGAMRLPHYTTPAGGDSAGNPHRL